MNATTTTERNALTLPQRAAVALKSSQTEAELRALVEKSADIKAVIDPAGREQAHRIGMTLKNARVTIQKVGKAAREDAQAFAKAVISEENRLCEIVTEEEDRVFGLRDAYDAKVEAERQAKIDAERKRIESIKADIAGLHEVAMGAVGKSAREIGVALEWARNVAAGEMTAARFAEFLPDAQRVIAEVIGKLENLHTATLASEKAAAEAKAAQEAEAARIAAERAELAKLRAEAAERDRLAKIEADKKAAAEREELERQRAAAAAARAEIEAQQAELARQQAEFQAKQAAALAEEEERQRVAAETKRQMDESAARAAAERQEREEAEAEAAAAPAIAPSEPTPTEAAIHAYTLADAIEDAGIDLFPTDAKLVSEIRTMFIEMFGMDNAEADARMAQFNYTEAAGLMAA